jgi:hypothetical protein
MTNTIAETAEDATMWLAKLTQADADNAVNVLIDRIIKALRSDLRMPSLTVDAWSLLFADAAARSRDELGALIEGKGDIDDAAEHIVEALCVMFAKKRRAEQGRTK